MNINLDELYKGKEVYPPREQIFRAVELCPIEKTKVVIIGQDPYHGPGQANGLAFSVNRGIKLPPSLRNIYEELVEDVDVSYPQHGDLTAWAKQGVLLLNTVLTVERDRPLSHSQVGWQNFTTGLIRDLNDYQVDVCYILWGIKAQEFRSLISPITNHIISSAHPSPFSAHRGFFGSRPFSKANKYLIECGDDPVDWSIK